MRHHAALAAALLLSGCAGPGRETIAREQDLRVADSPVLRAAARSWSVRARRQAVRAMGAVQSPAYADPLLERLRDRKADVRREAVFALGQLGLGDPDMTPAAAALRPLAAAEPAELRQAAVEALGKLGGDGVEELLRGALRDPMPAVRGEAALALFRLRSLKRIPDYSTATVRGLTVTVSDPEPEVRWRAVYALSAYPEPAAANILSAAAIEDGNTGVRLFACRALGQLKKDAPWEELVKALRDSQALVRTEAVKALGAAGRAEYFPDPLFHDASAHVRAAAADALAESGDVKLAYRLDDLDSEGSPLVRGQVLLAASVLRPGKAAELLSAERSSLNWWVRSRAYLASAGVPESEAALLLGLKDSDPRVAAAALEALAKSTQTAAEGLLDSVLRDPAAPVEVLGAAASASSERRSPALLAGLRAAYDSAAARRYPELASDLVAAAREILKAHPETLEAGLAPRPPAAPEASPFLGKPPKAARVILETSKGEIEIELAVEEAPVHSAAFLDTARRGLYDGTTWHRIVSDFVVQGGDPRGSGWGDCGYALRGEINGVRFERGIVGLADAGKDTGGCQFFITTVPAPKLDGRYTAFGRVVRGMDAVDLLEPGDKIARARVR